MLQGLGGWGEGGQKEPPAGPGERGVQGRGAGGGPAGPGEVRAVGPGGRSRLAAPEDPTWALDSDPGLQTCRPPACSGVHAPPRSWDSGPAHPHGALDAAASLSSPAGHLLQ